MLPLGAFNGIFCHNLHYEEHKREKLIKEVLLFSMFCNLILKIYLIEVISNHVPNP